jgi:uncharacterized protein
MIHNLTRAVAAITAVIAIGTGCQTYTSQTKTMKGAWDSGNARQAAVEFGKTADQCGGGDSVIWHLEAGTAYRIVGDFTESNRHLTNAVAQIEKFEQQARIKVGREAAAVMSNQQNLPYEGRSYDKIMLHTYLALNHLAIGEVDKARPEIIAAYQCQQDAVEENKRRIEKAQETEKQSKDRQTIEKARSNPKFNQGVDGVTKELEGFKFYANYVNPFTVYLDGLYFLHAGTDGSDLERARKSLSRVLEITGSNQFIVADLQLAESGNAIRLTPCTYVVFETGQAASRDQVRIDIPIIITSVSYVGAAFPKLVFHNDHAKELTVKAGAIEEKTVMIANMDSIIALDFKNEWPVVLTKTMISTVTKAVAAYAINEAAAQQSTYAGLFARVMTAATQAAMNIADTRSWTTLPKEFQVARIATPADRKITLSTPGAVPIEVAVADGTVNVVYVRSISASSSLQISQFKLR